MTKRWSSVRSDLISTKRHASKKARAKNKALTEDDDWELSEETKEAELELDKHTVVFQCP